MSRLVFREAGVIMGSSKKYFYRINPNSVTRRVSDKFLSRLRTNLWLCELAMRVPGARINSIARQGILTAFGMYTVRKSFSKDAFNDDFGDYIRRIKRSGLHWSASTTRPWVLAKLCFLLIYAKLKQI